MGRAELAMRREFLPLYTLNHKILLLLSIAHMFTLDIYFSEAGPRSGRWRG